MMAILTGVRWYLIAVFICISLMINNAEHLVIGHLYVFFGELCLFRSSAYPFEWVVFCY